MLLVKQWAARFVRVLAPNSEVGSPATVTTLLRRAVVRVANFILSDV
jgi:hypothetical protein